MSDSGRHWTPVTLGKDVPPPKGAYSPATRAGDLVFVSGQVPKDPKTGVVEGTTIQEQTRRVLENLRGVLAAAGATLDDVVSVTVYLADERDWDAFNAEYKQTFQPPYPARAVVGAGLRGVLVEVSAIACMAGGSRPA